MGVEMNQATEMINGLKGAVPIVIVDEEEEVILKKIDAR
jgi:hypothetical protein